MKAFVITAPGEASVQDVAPPVAGPGQVVVDVARVGVCGTDVEFFTGEMQYLHDGKARYPMRIGHEWTGTVTALGDGVDRKWLGRRVTGDTMLGCGVCRRCLRGLQHVCEFRFEVGILGGFPGALAELLAGSPSLVDTRTLALKDVTAVGILSASPGLRGAIDLYASGAVDPRPLVAATVGLSGVSEILAGNRPAGAGLGPKLHVDPRLA